MNPKIAEKGAKRLRQAPCDDSPEVKEIPLLELNSIFNQKGGVGLTWEGGEVLMQLKDTKSIVGEWKRSFYIGLCGHMWWQAVLVVDTSHFLLEKRR